MTPPEELGQTGLLKERRRCKSRLKRRTASAASSQPVIGLRAVVGMRVNNGGAQLVDGAKAHKAVVGRLVARVAMLREDHAARRKQCREAEALACSGGHASADVARLVQVEKVGRERDIAIQMRVVVRI